MSHTEIIIWERIDPRYLSKSNFRLGFKGMINYKFLSVNEVLSFRFQREFRFMRRLRSANPGPLDEIRSAFTNHNSRRIRVTGNDSWHDTGIRHSDSPHSPHSQLIVYHRERIIRWAHFAGTCLMILWCGVVLYSAFPVCVATEFQMLAILHWCSIHLQSVSVKKK